MLCFVLPGRMYLRIRRSELEDYETFFRSERFDSMSQRMEPFSSTWHVWSCTLHQKSSYRARIRAQQLVKWHPFCSNGLIGWNYLCRGPSHYVCFPSIEPGLCMNTRVLWAHKQNRQQGDLEEQAYRIRIAGCTFNNTAFKLGLFLGFPSWWWYFHKLSRWLSVK